MDYIEDADIVVDLSGGKLAGAAYRKRIKELKTTDAEILEAAAKNAVYIVNLELQIEALRTILDSYRIQYTAAMRATSLGLCKRAIKHALEYERRQDG